MGIQFWNTAVKDTEVNKWRDFKTKWKADFVKIQVIDIIYLLQRMGVISSNVGFVCFLGWLVKKVVLLNQFLQLVRRKEKQKAWNYSCNNCINYVQANYLLRKLQWHSLLTSVRPHCDTCACTLLLQCFYKQNNKRAWSGIILWSLSHLTSSIH